MPTTADAAMYTIGCSFFVGLTKKLHPIVYIAVSAVAGIVFSFAGA